MPCFLSDLRTTLQLRVDLAATHPYFYIGKKGSPYCQEEQPIVSSMTNLKAHIYEIEVRIDSADIRLC